MVTIWFVISSYIRAIEAYASERAIWVWGMSYNLIVDASARQEFFDFCSAPHGDATKAIKLIFFDARPWGYDLMANNPTELRQFLTEAHNKGFKVEFLAGSELWATSDYRLDGENLVESIIAFNQGGNVQQRFDGIQFDVEPYLLKTKEENDPYDWVYDRGLVWNEYITLLNNCQSKIDNYNLANDPDIRFGVTIPFWYNPATIPSFQQVIDVVDYVAIMAYRDTAVEIINAVKDEIIYTSSKGKSAYVAIETSHPTDNIDFPPNSTFYEEGNSSMENQLTQVHNSLIGYSGYGGLAIHYYEDVLGPKGYESSYRQLWTTSYLGHHPVVKVLSPNRAGEILSGSVYIQWAYSDLDNNSMTVDIQYSIDGGRNWMNIVTGLANTNVYLWDTMGYTIGPFYQIKVKAKDNSPSQLIGYDVSDNPFSISAMVTQSDITDLHLWVEGGTSLRLKWTPPQYTPRYYRIYRSVNGSPFPTNPTFENVITVDKFIDTGLSGSNKYKYMIRAVYGDGSEGNLSNPSNMLIPGPGFLADFFEETEGITYAGPYGTSSLTYSFDTLNVKEGSKSIKFNYVYAGSGWGAVLIGIFPTKIDISPYGAVEMWVKGGTVGGTAIKFQLMESGRAEGDETWESPAVSIPSVDWAKYRFNFSDFVRVSAYKNGRLDLHSIDRYGLVFSANTPNGTYYVDRIEFVQSQASIGVPQNVYDFGVVSGTPTNHRFVLGPIPVSFGGFGSPWTVRIWTNNGIGPQQAGLKGADGASFLPLKVWCVNYGPTTNVPDEENDYFWSGYDFGDGVNIGRQYQDGDKTDVYSSGTFDERYWGFDINGDGDALDVITPTPSKRISEEPVWLRIPEDDEMTANRFTWRRLCWSPGGELLSPFDIYVAIDTFDAPVLQQYRTTTLTLEYINE